MAADPKRRSLYGVDFLLPAGWDDLSYYVFRPDAEASPLEKLTFNEEPLPLARIADWLAEKQTAMLDFPAAEPGPVRSLANPIWDVRGFETKFGSGAKEEFLACAVVPRVPTALVVCAAGKRGYLKQLEAAVATLKPSEAAPSSRRRFYVLGLQFACPEKLRSPRGFFYVRSDSQGRLTAGRVNERPAWTSPDWRQNFSFPRDATLEVQPRRERLQAAVSAPHEAVVETARTVAVAVEPNGERTELFYGEACLHHAKEYLRFEFKSQVGHATATAEFEAIVASIRSET